MTRRGGAVYTRPQPSGERAIPLKNLRAVLGERLIADGAMGTELLALGLGGDCPEAWNVEKPEAVEGIHRGYVEAGARVLLTNSFGATEWKLGRSGRAQDAERFCRAAAENALRAAESAGGREPVYVLGDVGPTGELPEPCGARSLAEFEPVFEAQVRALVAGGVDGILVETMSSAAEATAAVRAARSACGGPVFASMTYSAGRTGYRTMMGETVAEATAALLEAGADVVGSNCGLGAEPMAEVIREVRAVTGGPVLAKPNAGAARLVGGKTVFDECPETWAAGMAGVLRAGANIVGGCCGTTPGHIARLRTLG